MHRVRGWGAFGGQDVDRLGCRTLGLWSAEGRGEGQLSKRLVFQMFQIDFALLSNQALCRVWFCSGVRIMTEPSLKHTL